MLDLGNPDGPLLLFGGPYSNLQATQALRVEADRLGIPAQNIVCSGDVVAYCAQPRETIALLRDWGVAVVMGNCEESIADNADDCGCGFEPGSVCDTLSASWFSFTNSQIDEPDRDWMRTLPRRIDFGYAGKRFAVIHGSVSRINQFVFASTSAAELREEIDLADVDVVVGGHCGLPFTRSVGDKLWHNPGVIGMPANDGSQRGWYSLLSSDDGAITFEHVPLNYASDLAHQRMLDSGLDNGYASGLLSGLWPSMDVLPQIERAARGIALEPQTIRF
ncbi:MAG: metallophosphoesterase family protein [Pseudomonadota bacterium]